MITKFRWGRWGAVFAITGAVLPAFAQFGSADGRVFGGAARRRPKPDNIFLGFEPVTYFHEGPEIHTLASLFWGEKVYYGPEFDRKGNEVPGGLGDWAFGGWFVFKGSANVWSLHADYWFVPNLSVVGAVYGGTIPGEEGRKDYAGYLAYNILRAGDSENPSANFRIRPAIRLAVGGYDYSSTGEGFEPSAFLEVSIYTKPWFSIDGTAWLVNKTEQHSGIERFGIGAGYRF